MVGFLNTNLIKDKKGVEIKLDNIEICDLSEKDPTAKIVQQVDLLLTRLQDESNQGTKKFNVPTIIVVTPDTYNVVDLNKILVAKYKYSPPDCQYDIHVSKLFAKHIKPEEQATQLAQKHPNAKLKRVLNVYIGTPNRILKL